MYISANAQGITVTYKTEPKMESININVDNPAIAEALRSQMAAGMTSTRFLLYNNGESVYQSKAKNADDNMMKEQSSSGITIIMVENDNSLYKNQKANRLISQEYIMDKAFLISEELEKPDWALQNEKKEIAGYTCSKATNKEETVTAWYCAAIPINDGPYIYWGLPGLIMQVETETLLITATEVSQTADLSQIKEPTSGKKTSREEFEKIRLKKMEEMGAQSGSGTNVKIDIINP